MCWFVAHFEWLQILAELKIYSIKNICVEMQIYLCFDKIQMEWLVYCAHEHVDRLFSVKRQRYIWCSCTFNNSTNVRHFPVQLMLLSLKVTFITEKLHHSIPCGSFLNPYLIYTVDILFNINIPVLNPKSLELDTKLEIVTLSFRHYQRGFKNFLELPAAYLIVAIVNGGISGEIFNCFISLLGEVALANAPTKSLSRWLKRLVKEEHEKVKVID